MEEEESKPRLFFLQQVFLWTVVKFHWQKAKSIFFRRRDFWNPASMVNCFSGTITSYDARDVLKGRAFCWDQFGVPSCILSYLFPARYIDRWYTYHNLTRIFYSEWMEHCKTSSHGDQPLLPFVFFVSFCCTYHAYSIIPINQKSRKSDVVQLPPWRRKMRLYIRCPLPCRRLLCYPFPACCWTTVFYPIFPPPSPFNFLG